MKPAVEQSFSYVKVTPADLYELFMDSAKHTAATGMPAKISKKVGGKWTAFGGMLLGKNLALVPNQMVVQTWRSQPWKASDPDSILIVRFEKIGTGAAAHLSHVGVPAHDYKGVTKGWKTYYWEPWKKYLAARKGKS